jgi:tetratricopeptide (TPR) repeat protein
MKNHFLFKIPLLLFLFSGNLSAQQAKISEKMIPLNTYAYSDPDPVPEFDKDFPYFRFDGYTNKGNMQNWKMVEMENDYIKLWVVPEIGGKIWGAIEKSTGKEFIYYNHSVKFRNIAMRGPWTSGGLEFNFGIVGHAPTTSSPVDYCIRKNNDGSVSCFVGAIDLASRTRWNVEINLPADKACFTTKSTWDNSTNLEQSSYHWMNLGEKTAGNLEYIFPGNHYLGHSGDSNPWPVDETGRDLSFYEKNNFGGPKSYHVFGELTDFYGVYWHDDHFGFAHYSPYDEKPGKKIWIWGLSENGMIWEKLLTDTDGQYTEIQSGRSYNQANSTSSLTPFKNRSFTPGSTDEWTEYWFPIKETEGLKNALPLGSVNLKQKDKKISFWFCPNEKTNGDLIIRNGSEILFRKSIQAMPMQVVKDSIDYAGDIKSLNVWLGSQLLYEANNEKRQLKRPVESPSDFNWETAYGYFIKGKELERQRLYNKAADQYKKSLEIEPWFVPALTGMADLSYRKDDYHTSMEYALKVLSVDTYNPDGNMMYGLSGLAMGDTTSAIDGFSIASEDVSHRSAACNALSSVCFCQGDYRKALEYAKKSLIANQSGSDAIQLKILCLRKLAMNHEAEIELKELEQRDPLNHFSRFEKYFFAPSSETQEMVKRSITAELPQETYMEYALWYYMNGQLDDALKILELAPQDHPVVLLWEGYLNHLKGNEKIASGKLSQAIQSSPQLVFPFRTETLKPLAWAQSVSDNWKIKYYTGLIYFSIGDEEKGRDLWESCGNKPDFIPFYIARSEIYKAFSQQAQADVDKALELGQNDWRTGLFASKYYLNSGNNNKSEEIARQFYRRFSQNFILGLCYSDILEYNNKFTGSIDILKKLTVLPHEGAGDGKTIWKNANIGEALVLLKAGKYKKALESVEQSRLWPANLGVGKPYITDERLEDFIELQCYKKLNDQKSVQRMQDRICDKTGLEENSSDLNDFLTAWVLKETNRKPEGDTLMKELLGENLSDSTIQWCQAIYSHQPDKAKSIITKADRGNRSFWFIYKLFVENSI